METLIKTLQESVTAFHTVQCVKQQLLDCGYHELEYGVPWNIRQGEGYLIAPYPSMIVAVNVGTLHEQSPLRLAVAHTDFPCLKIKPHPECAGKYYVRMNVEPYGGLLKPTWFDRPLGIAGKVVLKSDDAFHPQIRYVRSKDAVCIIPSLAPHLAKGSEQKEPDIQQEMLPIVGLDDVVKHTEEKKEKDVVQKDFLAAYLEEQWSIPQDDLLAYDLYVYNTDPPEAVGLHGELISSPRLDNLASVAALTEAMQALIHIPHGNLAVAAMFDNEEIGSRSKQGADSVLLLQLLDKLGAALGISSADWKDRMTHGFLLSMDGAHGYHPNYPDKSDPTNPVYLGQGPVIKTSAAQRYLSDSETTAIIMELCRHAGIHAQIQVNRSGMAGGQTLGPILSSVLPIPGADVGIPMLAMHSARELAAWKDYAQLRELAGVFFRYDERSNDDIR